jgi:alcohol dehydrogenase (NADP+)
MIPARAYAAPASGAPLQPFAIERRDPGPDDVLIEILYCGICHSDIHAARGEWGAAAFPMVPGHEIVGRVSRVGKKVKRFKPGDIAGVGCFVDSCRSCGSCRKGLEQYCETAGTVFTYNDTEKDGKTPTYGGYSSAIVVTQDFVLKIPKGLSPERAAPLLCAGITTYSPLKHWKTKKGTRLGVLGLGGLGHMAVKIGASMGAEVTVLSSSPAKEKESKRLGARRFALTSNEADAASLAGSLDLIIDTVSAPHDVDRALSFLKRDGTLVMVGASPSPLPVRTFSLIMGRRRLAGSLIGGIRETQEMLDYCGRKKIMADVEVIPVSRANEAWERVVKSDVRYRFVIDMKTL